ncbi:rcc01693 family protein [Histidinibacterium lentulum]|uniref:Phage tail assembly chaperone n=1 Tax=Histidinibacterium lentulum TaxID=2480588 RepID=A0A3N2R4T9_9RHOB|nr:rcc01693 family protein [Histidinibacterium lentulum]ROU02403.1 phage tail assembly chaperone [Histidinibacterium lentulum]
MARLDWAGLMRAGLRGLGLRPAEFWALTPVELALMLGAEAGAPAPMMRARLEELAARYPDKPGEPQR